jgi:CRP/FNR family transcriptional regulator, cyclic AMP receptor protein
MTVDLINLNCSLFDGLSSSELDQVISICHERIYHKNDIIANQGDIGNEVFIIVDGNVEILVNDKNDSAKKRTVAIIGKGHIIGEMGLVDQGPRSATMKAMDEPTILQVILYEELKNLCKQNTQIGFTVMGNLASEISIKLRRTNTSNT